MEFCKYLGDRSAALAVAQLPVAFLFAGRNRLLMYLIAQPQSIIRRMHIWISTGIGIDIVVHGTCYWLLSSRYSAYGAHWSYIYLKLGMIAGILIIFECAYSLLFIKLRDSTIYNGIHTIIAIVSVVGMGFHLDVVGDIDWLYASVALWCSSYIGRWVLILISGLENKGIAKLHPGGVIELTIHNSGIWSYKPGTYVYMHIAKWNSAWKLQPFYITEAPEEDEPTKIKAIASVKGVITKSAWNYLKRHPHAYAEIKVIMEGPYGMHWPLYNYDTNVIICGGLGISAGYGYATSLKRSGGSSKVIFVWLISSETPLTWFNEQLGLLADGRCEVQVFVNDFYGGLDTANGREKNAISGSMASLYPNFQSVPLQVSYERPNIRWIVFQNTMKSLGNVSFLTCAPESVCRDVRSAIGDNIETFNAVIDYYEEEFDLR